MVLTFVNLYSFDFNSDDEKENDSYMSFEIVLGKDNIIDKVVVELSCLENSAVVSFRVNVDPVELEELREEILSEFDGGMGFDILDSDVEITPDGNYVTLYVRRASFKLDELLSEIRWLNGNYRD